MKNVQQTKELKDDLLMKWWEEAESLEFMEIKKVNAYP